LPAKLTHECHLVASILISSPHLRATLKKMIDELQRTVAMKNVKIAQLENQIATSNTKSVRFAKENNKINNQNKVVKRRNERQALTNRSNVYC